MKQAEKRRVLVRAWIEQRDGRTVYVRRYRLERPVVQEVIEASGVVYVLGSLSGVRNVIVRINRVRWMPDISEWAFEVDAEGYRFIVYRMEEARQHAVTLLRAAGYRVRRAK